MVTNVYAISQASGRISRSAQTVTFVIGLAGRQVLILLT